MDGLASCLFAWLAILATASFG